MKSEKKKKRKKKVIIAKSGAHCTRKIHFIPRDRCSPTNLQWKINSVNWEGGYPRAIFFFFFIFLFFHFTLSLFFPPSSLFFFVFNFRLSVGHGIALSLSMVTPHRANTREECRIGWVTGWTCLSTFWNAVRPFLGVSSVIERVESKRKREKEATLHRNNQLHCNARCGIIPGI